MVVVDTEVDAQATLIGWKEIAAALNVCELTARRYERDFGLPVYRLGASVRLDMADLGRWVTQFKPK